MKHSKSSIHYLGIFIACTLCLSSFFIQSEFVFAAPPSILSYQGRLTNNSGNLLGGSPGTTYYFKFSIWSSASSGSKLWPTVDPTSYGTTVRDGVFNVNIGDTANGYPDALDYSFGSTDVFLQVEVSSDDITFETLTPRQQITSVAFAKVAGVVTGTELSTLGGFISNASSTVIGNLNITGNSTSSSATTTNFFTTTASTTSFFGGGLTNCPAGNVLIYDGAGKFGCSLDLQGAGTFPFTAQSWGNSTSTTLGFFNGFLSTASSTFTGGFLADRSTTTNATTTSLFSTTASSTNLFTTNFFGAGLTTCQSNNVLTWSGGLFGCETDDTGGTSFGKTLELFSVGRLAPTTTVAFYVGATTTASIANNSYFQVNATSTTGDLIVASSTASFAGNFIKFLTSAGTTMFQVAASGVASFASNLVPTGNDGASLGISGTAFSDLFLADGGVINWNAGNTTLTQSTGNLTLNNQFNANNLLASASSTLQNFTAVNSTSTQATTTNFAVSSIISSLIKTGTTGGLVAAVAGTDYENILTFSSGVSRSVNAISIDQNFSPTWTGSHIFNAITRSTTTQATSTNSFAGIFAGNSLSIGATATTTINSSGDLLVTGSSTLQNFTFNRATGTSATTTNFFSTTASSTNLAVGGGTLSIFGTSGTTLAAFCTAITGGAGLCDGDDGTSAGGTPAQSKWATTSGAYLGITPNGGINVNLGIGTTTPVYTLTVASSSGPQLALSDGAGIAQWTMRNAGGNLYFATTTTAGTATTSTSALSIIGSTGRVGIGTTTPLALLSVNPLAGTHGFTVGSSTATYFMVDKSGNVGVGTAAPTSKLEVDISVNGVANANETALTLRNQGDSGDNVYLDFFSGSSANQAIRFGVATGGDSGTISFNQTNGMDFQTSDGSGVMASRLTIESNQAEGAQIGIGTTTPFYALTIASSSQPQLSLSAGAGFSQWTFRNAGGNLYLATTTVAGTATTSISALEISNSGFGTTTVRGLNISGMATTTSNVGYNITTGCYAINNSCINKKYSKFVSIVSTEVVTSVNQTADAGPTNVDVTASTAVGATHVLVQGYLQANTATAGMAMTGHVMPTGVSVSSSTAIVGNFDSDTLGTVAVGEGIVALDSSEVFSWGVDEILATIGTFTFRVYVRGYWIPTELGADLAENYYSKDETLMAGDIVSLDPSLGGGVKKSNGIGDKDILGVISTNPAIVLDDTMNSDTELVILDESLKGRRPVAVALAGRVPVNVSAENGVIKAGDYLTQSSIPGIAMKATKSGKVIGQALSDQLEPGQSTEEIGSDIGSVLMYVNNSYYQGHGSKGILGLESDLANATTSTDIGKALLDQIISGNISTTSTNLDVSELFTDRVIAGLEIISPRVLTDSLVVNSIEPLESNISMSIADGGRLTIERSTSNQLSVTFDATSTQSSILVSIDDLGNAMFTGALSGASLEIGSREKPDGITLYDTETGEPYCTRVTHGQLTTLPGKCDSVVVTQPSAPDVINDSESSDEPVPAPETPPEVVEPETQTDNPIVESEPESESVSDSAQEPSVDSEISSSETVTTEVEPTIPESSPPSDPIVVQ